MARAPWVKTSGGEAGSRRRQRGRIRIEDVAELAGVSAITVSRVLRTPAIVAEDTRRRVDEAVDRLGYVPNLAAGTLASLKSRLVAVVVPTLRSSVYADTIQSPTSFRPQAIT